MTGTRTTERRETASLIGSDKVDGTAVYGSDQKRIGSIQRVMIDKISGKGLRRHELWRVPGHW